LPDLLLTQPPRTDEEWVLEQVRQLYKALSQWLIGLLNLIGLNQQNWRSLQSTNHLLGYQMLRDGLSTAIHGYNPQPDFVSPVQFTSPVVLVSSGFLSASPQSVEQNPSHGCTGKRCGI